ncbi:prostacyclin synthase-like isoform X2 [Hypomesus transpacificus]|uniref:prostacyclin synthase-like isoform X2 n=1 Tax=Hypomesus transpacificus TaxID=137520 RepID=UPI001F0787CF|nr:prostacyclin synthase-like isoform X2 [Hypomesus transpacificus]
MIWTIIFLIQAVLIYLVLSKRTRLSREPPLDKGLIPWLGHALEFGKDAAKFLTRMKMKHGDIFTVRVAGRYVTVLLDPHSYDEVLQDNKCLDFSRYAQILMERIFSLRLPHYNPAKDRAMMGQAGYLTLFGGELNNNRVDPSRVYKEFRNFDRLLTKMARNTLKPEEKRTAQALRSRLWELLAPAGLAPAPGSSAWLHGYRQQLQQAGADEDTQRRATLLQLWATQGNIGPAAFWLLGFLLSHPEALEAVRREQESLAPLKQGTAPQPPLVDCLQNTPVFDSALEEALRLTAAPFITREVLQGKALRMADGQEFQIRRGDRVLLFPLISPQMDPEVHQEPQKYKYDRFLNADGSGKTDFFKGGRPLNYYSMPWGAGANGCVGKRFAISTIRQFIYLVLAHYDLELCDPEAPLPKADAGRHGFGMLQPDGDVAIRYRLKKKS